MSGSRSLRFGDTTLRDGQLSLWSLSMRTNMMLPVVEILDNAGFESVEFMSTPEFKKAIRDLKEDPWERIRKVRAKVRKTPLRFIRGRYISTFQIESAELDELWVSRIAANGIDQFRISDSSNTTAGWRAMVAGAHRHGISAVLNLIFSLSPKHSDEYYAERTRQAAALKPDRLCLKDPGALITPERVKTLVPIVLANAGGIPVEFHTHCMTGMGSASTLEAIRCGVKNVNTGVPPLADGSGNPSIFEVCENARAIGYEPEIDLESLRPVRAHFERVARLEGLPVGKPQPYDYSQYVHQVPGGMISNFRFQLGKLGMLDRLPAVLEETALVRAELGYPIMVTPYSQFVGTQAAMNVIAGERYKAITEEIIHYALGWWGAEERDSIDPDIRDRILSSPRARELARQSPPMLSVAEVRRHLGGPGVSDDELLLRVSTDRDSVAAMRAAAPPRTYDRPESLEDLIGRLSTSTRSRYVRIARPGFDLMLEGGT